MQKWSTRELKKKTDFSENYSSSTVRGILSRDTNIYLPRLLMGKLNIQNSGSLERSHTLTKKKFIGLLPGQWSYVDVRMKISTPSTTMEKMGLNLTSDSCSTSLSWSSSKPNLKFASLIHMPFDSSISGNHLYIEPSLLSLLHRKCPYKKIIDPWTPTGNKMHPQMGERLARLILWNTVLHLDLGYTPAHDKYNHCILY